MPPKIKKPAEPTDRVTRKQAATSTPKAGHSRQQQQEEESDPEITFSQSNQTKFLSIMAGTDDESDGDEGAQGLPPTILQGVSKDTMAMMAFFQQQSERAAKAQAKQFAKLLQLSDRRNEETQAKQSEALQVMADQVARLTTGGNNRQKAPLVKLPSFDVDKDAKNFPQWTERWDCYLTAHSLEAEPEDEDAEEKLMTYLKSALTDNTLRWIKHQDIPDETRKSTEGILDYIAEHIKESTNPIVAVVELLTMKKFPSETADHLNARIQDKLNQCDFSKVTDIREFIGFLATMVAVESSLRKRMFLDKVDTYAKARIAVKSDEQATANAKLSHSHEASAHATSSYKKDQKAFRQNFNPEQEFRPRDQASSRGARGGYQGRNHDGRPDTRQGPIPK